MGGCPGGGELVAREEFLLEVLELASRHQAAVEQALQCDQLAYALGRRAGPLGRGLAARSGVRSNAWSLSGRACQQTEGHAMLMALMMMTTD